MQSSLTAQVTYTIDYSVFNSSDCNVLRPSLTTSAPVSINGRIHTATCGQPRLNVNTLAGGPGGQGVPNNSIILNAEKINNNTFKGTEYKIDFNFKKGYNYKITTNMLGKTPSSTNASDPYCNLLLSFTSMSGSSTFGRFCNGNEQYIAQYPINTSVSNIQAPIGSFGDKEYTFNNLDNDKQSLFLSSNVNFPDNNAYYSFIQIRKITIEETNPTPAFSLFPSTLTLQKGISTTRNFVISDANNTNGVTSLTWNIGATPNGWLYNGLPAPASVTLTNSSILTLSSDPCATIVKNITGIGNIGTLAYPTNSSIVTLASQVFSISGPDAICSPTSQLYYITSNICNDIVNWSVNTPSGGTVSLSNLIGNSTSVIVPSSFQINTPIYLTASFSGGSAPVTKTIFYGQPSFEASYSNGITNGLSLAIFNPSNGFNSINNVCLGYGFPNVYVDAQAYGAANVIWSLPSGYNDNGPSFNIQQVTGSKAYFGWSFGGTNPTGYLQASVSNSCGSFSQIFAFNQVNCNPGGGDPCGQAKGTNYFTISPNPANDVIKVGVTNRPAPVECNGLKALNTSSGIVFSVINIYNNLGTLVNSYKTKNAKSATIQIGNLKAGSYLVEIIQGDYVEKKQIIVQK